ncbi:translocation/assembly module TamB domain-containing protein [Pseudomonas japonica]|uniref:translocation/assembly module TamB domain-containing protein n=1 Tax=Pseudomonas japonica TaxID=256466 RepID=UPI0015E43668|nr:translocation/assembly module TamB domain-containing protein [Pseudomonas japonica]MBA1243477.1 translocation/assembly module TamB [Pseudomonas japonica]
MTRRWRWLVITGGALLALLAMVAVVMWALLGTERGSRWLLAHVPGASVEGFEGRLANHWQARKLTWAGADGMRVTVQAPRLSWSPGCLFKLTLCLDQVQAERVSITPPAATPPARDTGPLQLPDLNLPLALQLGQLDIGEVAYADSTVITGVHLAAAWNKDGLQIGSLQLTKGELRLGVEGTVRPAGQWPMDARVHLALPAVDDRPWEIAATLEGELANRLAFTGRSSGYLDANLEGTLHALADNVPATLRITADHFVAQQSLPRTLAIEGLQLRADGDLEQGYAIEGGGRFPAEQGPIDLRLRGKVNAQGAWVDDLSLRADDTHRVSVIGNLAWGGDLTGEASLDWQDFPWTRLYPQDAPPPVAATALKGMVRYGNGHFMGNLAGDFQGPAGPFSVTTPFSGDGQQLVLPQLHVTAGKGQLDGQLALGFVEGVSWVADLNLSNLDPAYWVAALPGKLGGAITSKGRFQAGALELAAKLGITGQLRGQPASLVGRVEGSGAGWQLADLDFGLGGNHLKGAGSSNGRLDGKLTLDAPRLDQLWPGLAGAVKGSLNLAGTPANPQGQLDLDGRRVAWESNRMATLTLRGRLDARQRGTLSLDSTGLAAGDTELGTLAVTANGDAEQHALTARLDGPAVVLAIAADGRWYEGAWKGRLAKGTVQSHGQAWALQAPAPLQRLADGTVDLGAHCWRSGQASLCADNQRLAPDPRIRVRLRDFPMASLKPWLPETLEWQATASADVQLDLGGTGPKGRVGFDASGGTLRVRQGEQWLSFPYGTLRLASIVAPGDVNTELTFDGRKLGQLNLQARLDPFGPAKALAGQFRFDGLDLSALGPLVESADKVAGRLQGNGTLGGTLLQPRVDGAFSLRDGAVSGPGLPLSVEALTLQARMNGNHMQLDGQWRSGAQGQGSLDGELDWSGALKLAIAVRASRLPITVLPYAEVEAGADLRLALIDQKLALSGKVSVPKGAITVRQLPPSTVKVSDDAMVVGRDVPARAQAGIAMDVDVDVGQEKLTFNGFGLQSDIVGRLHIGDNLDTRGSLELRNGRYRAYGQRLTLRRARLFFTGPVDQPYLDVEAIRQTDDVTAGIRLSGSVQQPTTEVFAEPAMSQEQALSWLILGRPLSTNGEDNNVLAQAALGLGLMGSASTAGQLANSLGIQDFQLDTEGSGDTTSVVASGNLTDRLTLRYGVGVFEPASTVALRYALTRQLYLEVASGVASSLDLFYKKDF